MSSSDSWILVRQKSKTPSNYAFTISISKKIVPLSTKRSRIKRLIREAIRVSKKKPPRGKMWNIVVLKPFPKETKLKWVQSLLNEQI